MKISIFITLVLFILMSCTKTGEKSDDIVYQQEDINILNQIFELFSEDKDTPVESLMVKVGSYFLETPYVAHTLETDSAEQLVVNLREMDCTTFAENCLAISRTINSGKHTFEKFADELKLIRYRDGVIDGYPSRLHYFSDWIYNNLKKMVVRDVTPVISNIHYAKEINFMSTHPESYQQLTENRQFIKTISDQEKEISERAMYYIPEDKIPEVEDQLMDGDIAGVTTNIEGLDISHVVILIRKAGRIHLIHASSSAKKVIISEETLEEYLLNSNSATGIIIARPN